MFELAGLQIAFELEVALPRRQRHSPAFVQLIAQVLGQLTRDSSAAG